MTQLGKLSPEHKFFLNPYRDERFTRCPGCRQITKARKKPFLVHVDPLVLLVLNMTGRYCPACDLIILHQDRVEELLVHACEQHDPSVIGNDYLVIGTVERWGWRHTQKHPADYETLFANLHDFTEYVFYELQPRWVPMDPEEGDE